MEQEVVCKLKPYAKELGKKLGEIRQEKGLSMEQVAELTGYKRSTIYSVENAKYNYGVEQLGTIAKALDCEVIIMPI